MLEVGVRPEVEPEIVSEALKKTWRREAICLSVQVWNILYSMSKLTVFVLDLSLNQRSVRTKSGS